MAKKQTKTAAVRVGSKRSRRKPTPPTRATRTRDARLPAPGTVLTRTFKGKELRLTVLDEGFRFEGTTYRSLTAAALRATGYPAISGPHFWKLGAQPTRTPKRAAKKGNAAATTDAATQPAPVAETASA
jgi:hypothetical protein